MQKIIPGDLVSFEIFINGAVISDTIGVQSFSIEQSLNRISLATITIRDGNIPLESFSVSESDTFVPGNEIEIKAGYDGRNTTLFKGIVTGQNIRLSDTRQPFLNVECSDKAIKLAVSRKTNVYYQMKDSDVFSSLIAEAGLISQVDDSAHVNDQLVQYYVSDWDFMLARAEAIGMAITTLNGKVSVFRLFKTSAPVLQLLYGEDLSELNLSLDSVSQLPQVKASAWDYKNRKVANVFVQNNFSGPGNLSSKKLSEVISIDQYELQTTAAVHPEELNNWAESQMQKSVLSKIKGSIKVAGVSGILPGDYISLDGLGARFNGEHFVSSVTHTFSSGNWFTVIGIGINFAGSIRKNNVAASAPSESLIPGIKGLFNGIVKQIMNDPDGQNRILVDVPLFPGSEGIWARFSGNNLTNIQPALSVPQIGDEVIVGFLNQDPRHPVILGNLTTPSKRVNRVRKVVTGSQI